MNDMCVDIAFSGGKLFRAKIVARQTPPAPVRVLYGGETALVVDRAGVYDIAR